MAVGIRVHPAHICWVTNNSTDVVIGSSVGLSGNRSHSPLIFFPQHDERLSVLYSVLITQYVVDTAAYNFWKEMKTNSEDLGSIFSPQPNQGRENIHCVSGSTEEVIGYVGAGSTSQYRAFIENSSLPATWNPHTQCSTIFVPDSKIVNYFSSGFIPLYTDFVDNQKGYDAAFESCADCTYKGSPVKPSFWP